MLITHKEYSVVALEYENEIRLVITIGDTLLLEQLYSKDFSIEEVISIGRSYVDYC